MRLRDVAQQRTRANLEQAERSRQKTGDSGVPFLRIWINLGGRNYVRDLEIEAQVETDPEGLSRALADLPGLFAYYAAAEAEARAIAKRAEVRRAKLHAEQYTLLEASQARTDAKGKRAKPTVDAIKSLILKDPAYEQAQQEVIDAELQLDRCTVGRQTTQIKKDVTLAVASNYRAELDARVQDTMRELRERHAAARTKTPQ